MVAFPALSEYSVLCNFEFHLLFKLKIKIHHEVICDRNKLHCGSCKKKIHIDVVCETIGMSIKLPILRDFNCNISASRSRNCPFYVIHTPHGFKMRREG